MKWLATRCVFLPLVLLVACPTGTSAFASINARFATKCRSAHFGTSVRGYMSSDDIVEDKENSDVRRKDDAARMQDLLEVSELAMQKQPGILAFFDNLQRGVIAAGWTFLLIGFLLNIFGYDYVMKDGRLAVDTMEASQFRREVIQAARSKD